METRLEPAGILLLESLDVQDVNDPISTRAKEEFRYCSEVFIVLTREVIFKDAVGVRELKSPCKLLLEAFGDILSKSRGFFSSNLNTMGLQSLEAAVGLIRFTIMLRALCEVMDAFEAVLDAIRPPSVDGGDIRGHGRQVLQKISISAGLTMDQYRKVLSQKLSRAKAQLESYPKQFGLSD